MILDRDRFHAGDETLFAELVNTYSARLVPYLRRFAGPETDVHDLLQEVWLRVYSKRQTFDGRGSLFGWLLTVGRTVGMAALKKREHAVVPQDDAIIGESDVLLRDALRNAVLALPERQRDVVILRLVEGLSTAETARLLQCAEGTVKATLHQATTKLREHLKEKVR